MNELHLILIALQNWRGSGGESAKLFSWVSTDRKHGYEPEEAQTGYLERFIFQEDGQIVEQTS